MASYSLIDIGRQYVLDSAGFLRSHPHAWLVYVPSATEQGTPSETHSLYSATMVSRAPNSIDPTSSSPVAIEIVKGIKPNVFPLGITLGRTENNDIVLRHEQVSRFHAYFQEQDGKLCIIDADSKNGTFLDGQRLTALKPSALPPEGVLRFGQIEVRILNSSRFLTFLEKASLG